MDVKPCVETASDYVAACPTLTKNAVATGELISFANNSSMTIKRPSSSSASCLDKDSAHILTSSTSSYFASSSSPAFNCNELMPKPRQKAASLTLESNTYPLTSFESHTSSLSNAFTAPVLVNGGPFGGGTLSRPGPPPRPPAIHVCENPLTDFSFDQQPPPPQPPIQLPSFASNTSLSQRMSAGPGAGEERLKSPSSMFNQSTTSHCNHQQYAHKERLFSLGPSFHIQLKHPSSVQLFKWRKRTKLEKHCIVIVLCLLLVYPLTVLLLYSNIESRETMSNGGKMCITAECVKTASSLLNAMDLTTDPCADFFQFACGSWNKRHIIPEDRSSISTFEVLADELQIILKDLLEQPASSHDNSATIKAKTFFKSCMKLDKIRDIGDTPLREIIRDLGGWPVTDPAWVSPSMGIEILLGRLRGNYNQGIILEQWVGPDDRNSSANIIQIDQMSFGLPSREYFLKSSSQKDKDAYYKLMVEISVLVGAERSHAELELEKVLEFETLLANVSIAEADRQDTGAIYRKMPIKELAKEVPQFNWLLYLNTFLPSEVSDSEPVVVYAAEYLREMGKLIAETDTKTIHNYAVWRLVKYLIPYLDGEYAARRADFKKVLLGVSAERVRWNQCVELVNKRLGMAVGALFIRNHFDPKSKETALEMIHNIRGAFNELLEENDWMDGETKRVARQKANAMNERIGYPDILTNPIELSKEYQQLQVYEDQFLQSVLNLLNFEALRNLNKLRQPVNKERWTTEPAVVNAFYNPNKNDIVFPAGILQPLFYSQHFPKSLNYGGIGVVIGHEITHGFDDKGRQFDKDGNLKQWWNNATVEKFRERASCIIDQYSSYVLEDIGLNVNGKMTQGENIADNGGLKQSYRAFKKWEAKYGSEPLLPGLNLTHDQLFFLNYAQIWCGSMRPEDALSKIRSSVHSPGPIRVLGPLSNSFDFTKAYNCPLESRMNPKRKCTVW